MPFLFALTLFVSATLLFLVQPMIGKMVLPLLGGSPAVWNTCMVFFQAALLAGYTYAHAVTRRLAPSRQLGLHLVLLLLPLVPLLWLQFDAKHVAGEWLPPPSEANPIPWLFTLLLAVAGLPFFVVATSAPLLQKWFADTGHSAGRDPYFLYGASNLGSMGALVAYPALIEPNLALPTQAAVWSGGYGLLILLIAACGIAMRQASARRVAHNLAPTADFGHDEPAPSFLRQVRWVALGFVPSSLMIGVTTHITTDVAPIPLLWVIPLGLYLLSFILVFARLPGFVHGVMILALVGTLFVVVFPPSSGWKLPLDVVILNKVWHVILLHLLALFLVAMVCHGELARTRPSPRYLTGFYLLMSLGGVLGGLFNGMVAPVVFDRILEYPLVAAGALLLMPRLGFARDSALAMLDEFVALTAGAAGVAYAALMLSQAYPSPQAVAFLPDWAQARLAALLKRNEGEDHSLLLQERNFYGLVKIRDNPSVENPHYRYMVHGTTDHGMQVLDDRETPFSYFHLQGPVGQIFEAVNAKRQPNHLGVLGVGTACLSCYAKKDWKLTLYEIDPAVVRLAEEHFTYLQDARARGATVDIHLGDGRLQVAKAPEKTFDILFMDAFASDSVPVHLITKEAMELYLTKLKPDGLVVVNIANRYLKLQPVMASLGQACGLKVLTAQDDADHDILKYGTHWVVFARDFEHFGSLLRATRPNGEAWFTEAKYNTRYKPWTDDFSNLMQSFQWAPDQEDDDEE